MVYDAYSYVFDYIWVNFDKPFLSTLNEIITKYSCTIDNYDFRYDLVNYKFSLHLFRQCVFQFI